MRVLTAAKENMTGYWHQCRLYCFVLIYTVLCTVFVRSVCRRIVCCLHFRLTELLQKEQLTVAQLSQAGL
jgi:hypothetical protein